MDHHRGAVPSSRRMPGAWASSAAAGSPMPSLSTESTAFRSALDVIREAEPGVAEAIAAELADQRNSLKLIASENYASPAVLLAMGNWFSDKYAEGTIGRRFYAGCANVDTAEKIAADHARVLFGAPHAYVQPHSGIDANLVAFWAILADRVEAPALAKAQVRHVNDRTSAGSVASAATAFSANGSMKPGWLKKRLILSISGAPGPTSARARSMSSRYWRQLE